MAVSFEDFDKNTFGNLRQLLEVGQVVGETLPVLTAQGQLRNGRWLHPVENFIRQKLPDIASHSSDYQQQIKQPVLNYLQTLEYHAETFERFDLQGAPSHILVDTSKSDYATVGLGIFQAWKVRFSSY